MHDRDVVLSCFCYVESHSFSPCISAAAQQYDGVSVCGCPESGSVEAALHQTLTPVQVRLVPFLSRTKQRCSVTNAYVQQGKMQQ